MDTPQITVLLIEDNPGDARLIREMLRDADAAPFRADARRPAAPRAWSGSRQGGVDVVLLDLTLPEVRGWRRSARCARGAPDVPVVVLTGRDDEALAVAAVQEGRRTTWSRGGSTATGWCASLRFAIERHARHRVEAILRATQGQIRQARQIQERLCPSVSLPLEGFDLCGGWYPAEATSGDFYDYIPLPEGRLGIVVADVCGHGLGPAPLMAETRAYLRAWP